MPHALSPLPIVVWLISACLWSIAFCSVAQNAEDECDGACISSDTVSLLQQDFDLMQSKRNKKVSSPKHLELANELANDSAKRSLLAKQIEPPKDGNLEFIHIPKNAGSSVRAAGGAEGVKWSNDEFREDEIHSDFGPELVIPDNVGPAPILFVSPRRYCSWYHVPPHMVRGEPNLYTSKETFCVTRDPYDKIVSQYKYRADSYHQGTPPGVADRLLPLRGPLKKRDFITAEWDCTADDLNHFIKDAIAEWSGGTKFRDDCHFIPQSEYVWGPDGHKWCDNVLRLDEFPEAFDNLMKDHGSPVRLLEERTNPSEHCENVTAEHLSAESRALIEDVYHDDFVKLNYSFWSEARS